MTTLFEADPLASEGDSSLFQAPSSEGPGLGISPEQGYAPPGIGIAPEQPAAPVMDMAAKPVHSRANDIRAMTANMSGPEKFFAALGEFGAGVQGKPSPLALKAKEQREDKLLQIAEQKSILTTLTDFTKVSRSLSGDAKASFIKDGVAQLNELRPGYGDMFAHIAQDPGLLDNASKYIKYLPPMAQEMFKRDPDKFMEHFSTADGVKVLKTAEEQYHLSRTEPKLRTLLMSLDHPDELLAAGVPADLIEAAKKNPTHSALSKIDAVLPAGNILKLSDEQKSALGNHADLMAGNLGYLGPKKEQEVIAAADKGGAPKTRTVIQGETEKQQEWDPKAGKWVDIEGASGPRFAKQVPAVVVGGADAGGLSPEAIDYFAKEAAKDKGVLANVGRGVQGAKDLRAILNKMAENEKGSPGAGVASTRAEFAGDAASLKKMIGNYDAITAFEENAMQQGKILKTIASKVDTTGVPVVERWIRAGRKNVDGDPEVSAFNAQMGLYRPEVAKILTNPNLTGVLTDKSQQEVKDFLGNEASAKQVVRVVDLLENDFGIRKKSIEGQMDTIKKRMAGQQPDRRASDKYVETRKTPDGRTLGKKADGTIEEIK